MRLSLRVATAFTSPATGEVELVANQEHFSQVVENGILRAKVSLDISTSHFKAMLVPITGALSTRRNRRAPSIVEILVDIAERGVEVRLMHGGVPSTAALRDLRRKLPENLVIRRCPRLHTKVVIVDCQAMYLGSANLTGAGLGAKADGKRNFELGIWTRSTSLIDAALGHFNSLWEGQQCDTCRRREICPVPLEEPSL